MESESQRQERQICDTLCGFGFDAIRQPGSGNQATSPNDVIVRDHFHLECKTTGASSFMLPFAWLKRAEALAKQFKVPSFLVLRFNRLSQHDYFIIKDTHFYSWLHLEKQNEELIHAEQNYKREIAELKQEVADLRAIARATNRSAYQTVDPYAAVRKKL